MAPSASGMRWGAAQTPATARCTSACRPQVLFYSYKKKCCVCILAADERALLFWLQEGDLVDCESIESSVPVRLVRTLILTAIRSTE